MSAVSDQDLLVIALVRHALIEYAAQRHPQKPLLEIASALAVVLERIVPEPVWERAKRLTEQEPDNPFRSAAALQLAASWSPEPSRQGKL